jgi:hypothetical protein
VILTKNASRPHTLLGWNALVMGRLNELVDPAITTLPRPSSAIARPGPRRFQQNRSKIRVRIPRHPSSSQTHLRQAQGQHWASSSDPQLRNVLPNSAVYYPEKRFILFLRF